MMSHRPRQPKIKIFESIEVTWSKRGIEGTALTPGGYVVLT